jgi:tripartite-type tricarboxylate transporter receptor subunit TctC
MQVKTLHWAIAIALTVLAVSAPMPVKAQGYPAKPISLVLPQPPGGAGPILGMMLAEAAKKYIKQPVVIDYRVGAGGTVGASYVAHAKPDGYTLLLARPAHSTAAPSVEKLDYDASDFEPMGQLLTSPLTLVVQANSPWKSLKDLVAYAKAHPGEVTCANSGNYSSLHLHALRFEQVAGIKLTHIPFVGGANAVTAVAGGHVKCATRFPGEGEALIDSGKVRVLTVFSAKRDKFYPNVPTSAEDGYPLEAIGWGALVGPKGTPKEVVALWEDILRKVTQDKDFLAAADKLKMNIEFKSAAEVKVDLAVEMGEFRKLAVSLGLRND